MEGAGRGLRARGQLSHRSAPHLITGSECEPHAAGRDSLKKRKKENLKKKKSCSSDRSAIRQERHQTGALAFRGKAAVAEGELG